MNGEIGILGHSRTRTHFCKTARGLRHPKVGCSRRVLNWMRVANYLERCERFASCSSTECERCTECQRFMDKPQRCSVLRLLLCGGVDGCTCCVVKSGRGLVSSTTLQTSCPVPCSRSPWLKPDPRPFHLAPRPRLSQQSVDPNAEPQLSQCDAQNPPRASAMKGMQVPLPDQRGSFGSIQKGFPLSL